MDKGYAIFRQIEVISDNEEYSVVQSGTKFGISLYDHIALNGSEVQEGDFLNQPQFVIKLFDNNQEGKIDDL